MKNDKALQVLLLKGRIHAVEQDKYGYIRIKVCTTDVVEIDRLLRRYGGNTYDEGSSKVWIATNVDDIRFILRDLHAFFSRRCINHYELMRILTTISTYCNVDSKSARWDTAKRIRKLLRGRSLQLADFLI